VLAHELVDSISAQSGIRGAPSFTDDHDFTPDASDARWFVATVASGTSPTTTVTTRAAPNPVMRLGLRFLQADGRSVSEPADSIT
jgi:hypothetical protein